MKKIGTTAYFMYTFVVVFLLLLGFSQLENILFSGKTPQWFFAIYNSFVLLIMGSPGIMWIRRKETISLSIFSTVKGRMAVFWGVLWLIVFFLPIPFLLISAVLP